MLFHYHIMTGRSPKLRTRHLMPPRRPAAPRALINPCRHPDLAGTSGGQNLYSEPQYPSCDLHLAQEQKEEAMIRPRLDPARLTNKQVSYLFPRLVVSYVCLVRCVPVCLQVCHLFAVACFCDLFVCCLLILSVYLAFSLPACQITCLLSCWFYACLLAS